MQDKNVFDKSEDLRERFKFIFEAVSEKMRSDLTEQWKDMNHTELKDYGKEHQTIKQNFNQKEPNNDNPFLRRSNSNSVRFRMHRPLYGVDALSESESSASWPILPVE